jgi:hypothetical protein
MILQYNYSNSYQNAGNLQTLNAKRSSVLWKGLMNAFYPIFPSGFLGELYGWLRLKMT